ncbi:MAG: N-acetylmuramoyl-L-alanine amidase [Rhizobiaceae bacterium]|nr:N-acetylmuramoyl-L-alanine amidase [Rhizobiaceae bacterium]
MLVLHYTGMTSGTAAEDWLADPASQVSSHYLVHEDGEVVQMVEERARAWHAGRSFWRGDRDVNSRSIGIEIVNPGHAFGYADFPERQVDAVIELCGGIVARHGMRPDLVLGHSDVAPGRKVDPGEKFPWRRLHAAGIGHWVEPAAIRAGDEQAAGDPDGIAPLLQAYGYDAGADGPGLKPVIFAFQQHFRPSRVDGVADRSTVETLRRLLAALPSSPAAL